MQVELEKSFSEREEAMRTFQSQLASLQAERDDLIERLEKLAADKKGQEAHFNDLITQKEEQTVGQIRYLQKRLREVCVGEPGAKAPPSADGKVMASYLSTVKQEMDRVLAERADLTKFVKEQGEQSQLVIRMGAFEEFKDRVLCSLEQWEQKALDLSDLSSKYYSELEENKKMFSALKQILKDKD
jgi:hypothetical protein